jgi:hypothetical protein
LISGDVFAAIADRPDVELAEVFGRRSITSLSAAVTGRLNSGRPLGARVGRDE